jgi:hypothetical protein
LGEKIFFSPTSPSAATRAPWWASAIILPFF